MTLHIYTARINYRGPDALDITRGTAEEARKAGLPRPPGEFLAPSAGLVFPTLRRLRAARSPEDKARVWAAYEAAFLTEMAQSYARRTYEWDALLEQDAVTLCCYCVRSEALAGRCHRILVARELVARGGAVYHGEVDPRARVAQSTDGRQVLLAPSASACHAPQSGEAPESVTTRTLLAADRRTRI